MVMFMVRVPTIGFALALITFTGNWLIQDPALAETSGSSQKKSSARSPDKAAQEGLNFLKKQFSPEGVGEVKNLRREQPILKESAPKGLSPRKGIRRVPRPPEVDRPMDSGSEEQTRRMPQSEAEKARMMKEADKYAIKLGFFSAAETARAQMGETALRVMLVRATRLSAFKKGDDPNRLLQDAHTKIFPIYVQEEGSTKKAFRSSITVAEVAGKPESQWDWIERGSPEFIKIYEKYKDLKPDKLVKIIFRSNQTIFIRFLGVGTGENFKLIPIYDFVLREKGLQTVRLKSGEAKPASEIFTQLSPYAARILTSQKDNTNKRLLR